MLSGNGTNYQRVINASSTAPQINQLESGWVCDWQINVTNILECTQQWSEALQSRLLIDVIYLDFKKAFDSISHSKLFLLQNIRLWHPWKHQGWITDFLSLRSQRINIGGTVKWHSCFKVLQGSFLVTLSFCCILVTFLI